MAASVDGALVLLLLLVVAFVITIRAVTAFVFIIWMEIRGVVCKVSVAYDGP